MGVKTKEFGRFFWLMFEGVAKFYDELDSPSPEIQDLITEFFLLIGLILPCVYCRRSYRGFLNSEPDLNVERALVRQQGVQKLVYALHNRVNRKLKEQELEQATTSKAKRSIQQKWQRHTLTWSQARQQKFPSLRSHRFWNALTVALGYMMCDYDQKRAPYLRRFMTIIGDLLAQVAEQHDAAWQPWAQAYGQALTKIHPLNRDWQQWAKIEVRFEMVWIIHRHLFRQGGWTFNHSLTSFEEKCQQAIVSCPT